MSIYHVNVISHFIVFAVPWPLAFPVLDRVGLWFCGLLD